MDDLRSVKSDILTCRQHLIIWDDSGETADDWSLRTSCVKRKLHYTCVSKAWCEIFAMTFPSVNRFSKFFR